MPIVFEAPGPISPDTSVAAGAAQAYLQSLPAIGARQNTIAGIAENQARLRAAQAAQAAQPMHVIPTAPAIPYIPSVGGGGGGHLEMPPVQPDRFTQAENLRLQQLEAARVTIESRVQSGEWTPEEGNDALTQINTGYNILDQRRQRAQAQIQQEQHQMLMQTHAQQSAWQNMSAADRAQRFGENIFEVKDTYGNVVARMYADAATGRMQQIAIDRNPSDPATRQEATQRQLADMYHQAEQSVDHQLQQLRNHPEIPQSQWPEWARTPSGIEQEKQRRMNARRRAAGIDQQGGQPGQQGGQSQPTSDQEEAMRQLAALQAGANLGDPGLVQQNRPSPNLFQMTGTEGTATEGVAGFLTGGFAGPNVFAPRNFAEGLRHSERVERPNAPAEGITRDEVQRVLNVAGNAWNNSPRHERFYHRQLQTIGEMVDLLNNVRVSGRRLTRQELSYYNTLRNRLTPEDQRNLEIRGQ